MTLLDKLKQATGADRELDAAIALQFRVADFDCSTVIEGGKIRRFGKPAYVSQEYTASVDACLALMGEVLPDWWVSLSTNGPTSAMIGEEGRGFAKYEDHPVLPIALLIAIMRAVSEWS